MNIEREPLLAFFREVEILAQLIQTALERVLPGGMTMAQFAVLDHFIRSESGVIAPAVLARALQVTKATMTSTLQRLESKGLILIVPDPDDGRAKRVSITEAGRAMRGDCLAAILPECERFKPLLGAVYIPGLTRDLARVRTVLDKERE